MSNRISKKIKYGILAVFDLAENYGNNPVHLDDIVKRKKIPKSYISQILNEFTKKGIIKSKRGKEGGFYLNVSPQSLTLLTLFEVLEDVNNIESIREIKIKSIEKILEELFGEVKRVLNVSISELIERERDSLGCLSFQI
ncbi:MAG: Rrf2 family transcriptional regulator [Chitinispirillaceae bacterium]|nr:Rrf2 family transcriptional regulator [Chitinispirillaceae bacterium]